MGNKKISLNNNSNKIEDFEFRNLKKRRFDDDNEEMVGVKYVFFYLLDFHLLLFSFNIK